MTDPSAPDADPTTATHEFDSALTITDGRADLSADWVVGEAVNGGILMSLATRAAQETLAGADSHTGPIAFSTTFLKAAQPGPAASRSLRARTEGAVCRHVRKALCAAWAAASTSAASPTS